MEIHTILVPTDFSTYAAHALQEACAIAAHHQAQVLLVHVHPPLAFWGEDWAQRAAFEAKIQAGAEQQLQAMAAEQTVPIETRVLWGDPATTICGVAQTHPCELIVMSTHGHTGLARVFIGSVAERVVRYAPCAVLIVRAFPEQQP
jgi:nucleotide-binding universal stress UspA family protein